MELIEILSIIYIIAMIIATFMLFYHQRVTRGKLGIIFLLLITFFFLLYKLNQFPNVFIDEANGYYDAYSLARYGVDSHLMKFPIYLQSYAGQGQSVLLAYLAIPFLKLFGFSLLSFRLTLVVASIVAILLSCYTLNKYYPNFLAPVMLSLCTAPYLITNARYAIDCNISLWVQLIMTNCLLIGIKSKKPILPITLFYFFCGLLAYSYNVAWIYLILVVISISILLYKKYILSLKAIILELLLLLLEIIPILTFAVRSNIKSLNRTINLGILTIPELPMSRANTSFINFHGDILKRMVENSCSGFKMLFLTSDGLTWNSIPGYNAYYSFAIITFVIGLYWGIKSRKLIEVKILFILLLSNIIIWLIVQPNYNHWMFTHVPSLFIIGIGLKKLSKVIPYKYLYGLYLLIFLLFYHTYFITPRYTGFNMESIRNVKDIQIITKGHEVYFNGDDKNLLLVIRDFSNISPYEFQRTKDSPYSHKNLLFYNHLANYHRATTDKQIKEGNYLLTTNKEVNHIKTHLVKQNMIIGDTKYYLFRLR